MATCKQTAAELIQDVFSPCVAVLCSSDVETVCAKNNLTFVEMIQPFCRLNTEASIRDPSNVACSIKNLRINMKEMNLQLPPLNVGKKVMHDAVANNTTEGVLCNTVNDDIYELKYSASTPWFEAYREVFFQVIAPTEHEFMHHYLSCIFVVSSSSQDPLSQFHQLCQEQQQCQMQNSGQSTRWFFTYIFKYYLLLHDTTSENLAKAEAIFQSMKSCYGASVCHLLQINSSSKDDTHNVNSHEEMNGVSNLPDPWSQFLSKFYAQQEMPIGSEVTEDSVEAQIQVELEIENEIENGGPDTNEKTTIHHPLLNSTEDLTESNSPKDTPKKGGTKSTTYCGWGRSSNCNKKHGLCLTLSDMDRIRVFVQDYCIQGLVPFVEKQIRILSDQVTNRKSIHRTIFGVTKKLFAGNKPGVQSPVASANSVVYGHDAPELQVRKLGDLAFMFQLYEVAYQAYHTAKRDFSGEAWLHFAGSSELAALSVFMQRNSNVHEYPARYMEAAITTYLYTCKLPELAIRATLLSTECLKAKGLFKDAALQFSRILTEADLPSALLLEQAAHCTINCSPPYIRKYMFNLILAGHRFSKCGQRKHTLRAYKQVEQAYEQLGWNAARNHIKSLIGRTSAHLKHIEIAYNAFTQLLSAQSEQASIDQTNCLKDYLSALKEYSLQQPPRENFQLQCLPIPVVDCQSTKILIGEENMVSKDGILVVNGRGFDRGDLDNEIWSKLEEKMLVSLYNTSPSFFVPQMYCFTSLTNNVNNPTCVTQEIITIEVVIKNPLSISFAIDSVFILWTFTQNPDANSSKDPVSFSNELDVSKALLLNSIVDTKILPKVTFEAHQEKKIHFTLQPFHPGSLLIRGISYCLQGPLSQTKSSPIISNVPHLQGKQVLEVCGPRLNKTASERSTKVYAEDNRLNVKVIPSMLKLQVRFNSFPSSLFCGEIKQSSFEIVNVGTQAIQRIIVATSMPSVFAIGQRNKCPEFQVYNEVPCTKRSVHLVKDWEECDWKLEIRTASGELCHLEPGESLSLPVWFRGPELPGKYNIELLFYYEADLGDIKPRHRLVQYTSVLNAKPSLNLQAKTVTSQNFTDGDNAGNNSLLLSLVVANNSEELSEISVVQVSSVSSLWHLSSSDELIPKSFPVILPRESLLMALKACCISSDKTDSSPKSMVVSNVPLGCFEIDTTNSPCSEFIRKSRIRPDFLSSDAIETSNFDVLLSPDVLLLLTVIWKAKFEHDGVVHIVTGQHHMRVENFGLLPHLSKPIAPQSELSTNLSPLANHLVQCYLVHPFNVEHNFSQKRIITVPVDFIVQNTCNLSLQILLDNADQSSSHSMAYVFEDSQTPMSQTFMWIKGSKRSIELDPAKTIRVPLHASFFSPGTYNLGCLSVKVLSSNDTVISYIMSPFLITISACNTPVQ